MEQSRAFLEQLNRDYLGVHQAEGDLYWLTHTGLSEDHAGYGRAALARKRFVADPARLAEVRVQLDRLAGQPNSEARQALLHDLRGWLALFECNIVEQPAAIGHMRELSELDAALFGLRRDYTMFHLGSRGEREAASPPMLYANMANNPDEAARRSSHEALLGLERWILENGFLAIVAKRNALARALGYRNYFDYKLRLGERISPEQLFEILDDFEVRTRAAQQRSLAELAGQYGETALLPHNLRHFMRGSVSQRLDAYMPFGKSLGRWAETFRRLGIGYRGATMQLDLLERKGKFQMGFSHAPGLAYHDGRTGWVPARINFTAFAKPDQPGAGERGIGILFHEAGHAAHFANIAQRAACFSLEYEPTSKPYLETQSKFCDRLVHDPDWLKRYALDADGQAMPDTLIRAKVESAQRFRAFDERSDLIPSYFEWALYSMDDAARTPEAVLALARSIEQRILGVPVGPRPVMALVHIIEPNVAAAYHSYLLAQMAVYQTRAYLQRTLGFIVDNPAVGPLLARHYWVPGNSLSHAETLRSLTGEGFTGRYLAEACNQPVEAAWQAARQSLADAARRRYPTDYPASLDASIRVVHGAELVADNSESEAIMATRFEAWVASRFPSDRH